MEEKRIGEWIQRLRKQKGVTQQELANALGVTTQAVSKWENGGTPDAQLLPTIADFFGVPIDALFGRETKRGDSLAQGIIDELANIPEEQRVQQAYEYCWAMQVGLCGELLEELKEQGPPKIKAEQEYYSRILQNGGMTEMKVNEDGHYFFLLEEAEKNNASLLAKVSEYKTLFQTLAEENTLAVLLFLYQRK